MRYRNIAKRYLLEKMIAVVRDVDEDLLDNLAKEEDPKRKKTLTDLQQKRLVEKLQQEVERYRDRLVKTKLILDGVPLPWEFNK